MIARHFTIRRLLLVAGTTVAGLAFPAVASARLYSLNTSPVKKNDGFKVHLNAYNTNAGYGAKNQTTFTVYLRRTTGHATQAAAYAFSKNVKLTGSKNLSSGRIKGTLPDGRGSINMTFHGRGSISKASVPKGCMGTPGKKRMGTWSGTLRLKADRLGTVRIRSEKGRLSTAIYNCVPRVKGYLLEGTHGKYYVTASKPSAKGPVREAIQVTTGGRGYGFTYVYSVANEPTSDFTVSSMKSAKVKGAGGIGGNARYSSTSSSTSHTYGSLKGTLYAKMAAIGVVRPFAAAKNHTIGADLRR